MRNQIRSRSAVAVFLCGGASLLVLAGCGATADGTPQALGAVTTKPKVVAALNGTGYEMKYRKVPHLQGYEIVSGEAIEGKKRVQFTVTIDLSGPFESRRGSQTPLSQPPVLRYGAEEAGKTIGNVHFETAEVSPAHAGKGSELTLDRAEAAMTIKVGVTLSELFASKYQPGP